MSIDILLEKEYKFEGAIEKRHIIEGLILPTLVLPPEGREDFQTGNYENCAIWTGMYVAAQSLKYASTGNTAARANAKRGLLALHRLRDITKGKTLIARGYKYAASSEWDEEFFWKKKGDNTRQGEEWHQNGSYRWLGDPSKSQVFGMVFGYFAFTQFCGPDAQEKEDIAGNLSEIVEQLIKDDFKIVDADGKASGYGNYLHNHYWGFGGTGPLLILGMFKLAAAITQKIEYEKWHIKFLDKYQSSLGRCRLDLPVLKEFSTALGSEDNLVMLNYYMLMCLETNPEIRKLCRQGMEKRVRAIDDPENSLFNFLYHASTGSETSALQTGIDALYRFPEEKTVPLVALKRKLPDSKIQNLGNYWNLQRKPIERRPVDEYLWRVNPWREDSWRDGRKGIIEFTGVDFLLAIYLGMKHGFVN